MVLLLGMIGCGPRWAEPAVVAPTLARLDADKSGRVEQAEYEAVLLRGAAFANVDLDADGALSADELVALVAATDPTGASSSGPAARAARLPNDAASQKPRDAGRPGGKVEDPGGDAPALRSEAQLMVKMILESLREEVRAAAPNSAVPTDDEIKLAAGTADIRTAECRALLLRLEAASNEAGIGFPASLREAVLRDRPVTVSFVPGSLGELPGPGGPGRSADANAGDRKGPMPLPRPTDPRTPDGTP